tara:strand:+ start:100 stop:804 length:705 start_codon:yes stop_codon:yes gene_type:complete
MKTYNDKKSDLVNKVFSDVYKKYDVMNDIMSFGIHRLWKKNLISWMRPQKDDKLIDVASGTGDLAKYFSIKTNHQSQIYCVEPNTDMLKVGKKKLETYKNVKWFNAKAEKLPFDDETFDFYTISFGIRNVSDINKSLKEALRVLKTGGKFFCLEFSKIQNDLLNKLYSNYSKIIPSIGKLVVGNSEPYDYLVNSIKKFYDQEELQEIISKNGFSNIEYRNLLNGTASIHTGWKI